MNKGVAASAWRYLVRPGAHPVNCAVGHVTMALVTQRVDTRHVQQAGILRTVRSVAGHAPLGLNRRVLVHERPTRLGVTFRADRILIGRRLEVVVAEGAVRVVAIGAPYQTLVDLVMK